MFKISMIGSGALRDLLCFETHLSTILARNWNSALEFFVQKIVSIPYKTIKTEQDLAQHIHEVWPSKIFDPKSHELGRFRWMDHGPRKVSHLSIPEGEITDTVIRQLDRPSRRSEMMIMIISGWVAKSWCRSVSPNGFFSLARIQEFHFFAILSRFCV